MTGFLGLFQGDPKFKTLANVKNPALQSWIDSGITDYGTVRSTGQNALKDYISKYMAGEGAAGTRTGEEIGNIDRYFNGGAANELSRLRAARSAAIQNAANLGSNYALANVSRSRAAGEGGPSSYDRRLGLRSINDIMTQAAVDDAAQQRGDWNYLEQSKLGLTGRRQSLADALAGYGLVPENVRRQMYSQDLGYLGTLGSLDQANKFYGVQQKKNTLDKVIEGMDKDTATLTNLIAAVRGGGGGTTAASPAQQTQWQPSYLSPIPNQWNAFQSGMGPVSTGYANTWSGDIWNAGAPNYIGSYGPQSSGFYGTGAMPDVGVPGADYSLWSGGIPSVGW